MPTLQRGIIYKKEHSDGIDYGVQFNVIVVPVFPFRTVVVINMTEDQDTVSISDFLLSMGKLLKCRIQETTQLTPGGLLFPG